MSRAAGQRAERLAADHLRSLGLRLVETNYTCKGGEIDLVCEDGDTLVFVEVRARSSASFGAPEETVRAVKQRRLIHAARHYLTTRRCEDRACRFDVVAVEGDAIT